jgi:hypothetical protein
MQYRKQNTSYSCDGQVSCERRSAERMSVNKAASLPEEPGKTCSLNTVVNCLYPMAVGKQEIRETVRDDKETQHNCKDRIESLHAWLGNSPRWIEPIGACIE